MTEPARPSLRPLLLKAAVLLAVLVAGAVLVLRGYDVRGAVEAGLAALRGAGPVVFFTAMAILPACGFPALTFVLPAVPVFGPQLGTATAVLLGLAALTFNYCLAYGLARGALRPLLERLVVRLGYRLPEVETGDAADLVILLRVTPGVPFVVQNYLAGLARLPFGRYFVVSAVIVWPINTAFLLFGDALLHGKGKVALLSLCAIVALTTGLHLVRRHYERRRKAT
jgi:uncharacterized membrane protein YdjX (TVP38/TMEM64 family)